MHDWDSRHLDGPAEEDDVEEQPQSSYYTCFRRTYSVQDILEISDDIGIAVEEHAWKHRPDEVPDDCTLELVPSPFGVEVRFVRARA